MNKRILFVLPLLCVLLASTGCQGLRRVGRMFGIGDSVEPVIYTDEDFLRSTDTPLAAVDFSSLPRAQAPAHVGQPVYFGYNQSALSDLELTKIQTVATFLRDNPSIVVLVEGNCDERGTNEYNLSLGQFRAIAVRDRLCALGIAAGRIDTVSYGEEKPAVSGHNESAWSANRRAEFSFFQKR